MKAQSQPVVLVLTATVIVGTISTVYVWGQPLLQKGQEQAKVDKLEEDALRIQETALQTSRSGSGTTETVRIGEGFSTSGQFRIRVNESGDYIEITESMGSSPYETGSWTLIEGSSLQNLSIGSGSFGVKGENLPGVVAVKPLGTSSDALLNYRIEFRNLYTDTSTGERLEKIDLVTTGRSEIADPATIVLTNEGVEWDRGSEKIQVEDEKEFERRRTKISVDLR